MSLVLPGGRTHLESGQTEKTRFETTPARKASCQHVFFDVCSDSEDSDFDSEDSDQQKVVDDAGEPVVDDE